ncbi:type III secretion system (T3SS) SseB-like protein [Motilibacter peucedani]|uniref:Type III secretion system (T3SS) SseB-like protein n=1 Tax=Motilibacter peucedani TaxID=598650 RepID=A0A420XN04_9ACTN|nr:SAV_915 family protein [Motilibacter peucedani]RKS72657.1 type III secretion system (T3SS) SseB-like protein [Motilibacter peucedani]
MPETKVEELGAVPDGLLLVPAHPGEPGRVRIEPRLDGTGAAVLVAFTSTARLVEALGPAQPWVAVPGDRLPELARAAGLRGVLVDPVVPPGSPGWTEDDLERLGGNRRG